MRIRTKLGLGTGFLFIVILIFGVLSLVSVGRLKNDASLILQDNYESLMYCSAMTEALDKVEGDNGYKKIFEENLQKEQNNITEPGEGDATAKLAADYELLKKDYSNDSMKVVIRQLLHEINGLNQAAIFRKNQNAAQAAEKATTWLMVVFTLLILITFTIAYNFPSIVTGPVASLTEGIRAIENKDYSKRIHVDQDDEFGELAGAFNAMAERLNEYEHSNLARIKFEKSRIETIINQMNDGIIGLDDKKNILFLNAVSQKLLGLKEKDIAGKYAPDVALTNDLMRTLLGASLNEPASQRELKIFADNKESYFQAESLNVKNNERIIGEVIILRNITLFHELNEAKTNFIATVSHELKTPISSIKMSVQLLADERVGTMNNEQKELVKSIYDDSDRLLKITSELLNMSQVETGRIQLKTGNVSCKEIIDAAVQAVQLVLQQKNIALKQDIAPDLPGVIADKEKTSWALINFLTNAVKHSLTDSEIILEVNSRDDRVEFRVRDFGMGMEEKYLSRIFDRYYKIPGHLNPGSGLGLSIAKEFIEAQSGRVWVESMPGAGSVFGFDLPRSR